MELDKSYDVQFVFTDGRVINAHREVLKKESPVFDAMFSSDWDEDQTGMVQVVLYDADSFAKMIEYIYSNGTVEFDDSIQSLRVYDMAQYYQMADLKKYCLAKTRENFNRESAEMAIEIGKESNDLRLVNQANKFLRELSFQETNPLMYDVWKKRPDLFRGYK